MILYKITCIETGLIYIGITSVGLSRRWNRHWSNASRNVHSALYAEMRRISTRALWTIEILSHHVNYERLLAAEILAIAEMGATNPAIGYNRTAGGQGCLGLRFKKTPEQIEKSARFHRGRKLPEDQAAALRGRLLSMATTPRRSKKNPERDAAIMAHYYFSPSLAATGNAFGIKAAAVCIALARCRRALSDTMATDPLYENFVPPPRIHPDHLGIQP